MKDRDFHMHDGKTGSAITVSVIQRANQNEISEILADGTVKVRLASATSSEEKVNQALVSFLSQVLQVKPEQIEIVAGLSGKDKLVTITDLDKFTVTQRILQQLK